MEQTSNIRELKSIISRSLRNITMVVTAVIMLVMLFSQVMTKQSEAKQTAHNSFVQIEHMLAENAQDLREVKGNFASIYLSTAEIVAYMLSGYNDLIYNVEQLQHIASLLDVEEIWVFDDTGRIISGTNPDFFGMTMNDGEQMAFFKPMLKDKTLELAQDILPRTVDGALFQYSAVWNTVGTHIIEIGRTADSVMKMMEKYDLSHIFSLLSIDTGADLYAIDVSTGLVAGASSSEHVGKNAAELGIDLAHISHDDAFHARINNVFSYCVFSRIGDHYIGRVVSASDMYFDLIPSAVWTAMVLLVCALMLVFGILRSMEYLVLRNIRSINTRLAEITAGALDQQVEEGNSLEFSELSRYINTMVASLRDRVKDRERIFRIVSQHSNRILYQYDISTCIPRRLDEEYDRDDVLTALRIGTDSSQTPAQNPAISREGAESLTDFFASIHGGEPSGETDAQIYLDNEENKWYHFKYSTIFENGHPATALISAEDVTERYKREQSLLQRAEYDAMTGLLRRDSGEELIAQNLTQPHTHGGVLIVLDLDDLKGINDTYGHGEGDRAIINIANALRNHFHKDDVVLRAGGDEFMIFLPQMAQDIQAVETSLSALLRQLSAVPVGDDGNRTLHCSVGCAAEQVGTDDFESLYRRADIALYQVKRSGKNNFAFYHPSMEQKDYEFRSKKLLSAPTKEAFAVKELQHFLRSLSTFYQLVISANLSRNTYDLMEEATGGLLSTIPNSGMLTDFLDLAVKSVHADDMEEFKRHLTRENLLAAYGTGAANVCHQFRFHFNRTVRWVECVVIFYVNETGEVCDFTLLRWADGNI